MREEGRKDVRRRHQVVHGGRRRQGLLRTVRRDRHLRAPQGQEDQQAEGVLLHRVQEGRNHQAVSEAGSRDRRAEGRREGEQAAEQQDGRPRQGRVRHVPAAGLRLPRLR